MCFKKFMNEKMTQISTKFSIFIKYFLLPSFYVSYAVGLSFILKEDTLPLHLLMFIILWPIVICFLAYNFQFMKHVKINHDVIIISGAFRSQTIDISDISSIEYHTTGSPEKV